ncbi:DNA polymerase lambda [Penicillium rolfsii]|nr:DNA polymerase lambda [Penicillium rolfsii]
MLGRRSKASFFRALEDLDCSDDSQEDENSLEHLLARVKPTETILSTAASHNREHITLTRANTAPSPSYTDKELQEAVVQDDHPRRRQQPFEPDLRTVKRSQTTGTMPSTTLGPKRGGGPAPKKRRTDSIVKLVPEEQRIFKELVFFFFPNNDISPSRRLRIQRAREYGAHCTLDWTDKVTHVIVDKDLQYQDLIKHIKIEPFPGNVVFVNESYPAECIRFRSILSPSQMRFRVEGNPASGQHDTLTPALAAVPVSVDSLPLKAPRKEQEQTPEPSQSPAQQVIYDSQPAPEVVSTPAVPENSSEETRQRDALDETIAEAKATSHLPLDLIDSSDEESGDSSSESESLDPVFSRSKQESREGPVVESWARNFACMQKFEPDNKRDNPNNRTIEVLQQMLDYYTRTGDHWRTLAYRKGINSLRRQTKKITSKMEARSIPGIGERLAEKIEEIVLTDHLSRLDHTNETEADKIIQEFLGIYGCGLTQASKWVAQGYRSLSDLRERAPLTKNLRIGLERYHDFAQRIPRKEVEAHAAVVQKAIQVVDKDMQVIIGGSYRRGALDSGDIDLLITKPDATLEQIRSLILDTVVPQLFHDGFLQVGLQTSHRNGGGSKWQGASVMPGSAIWRRLDLLFVPGAEFGAAMLYFTGNDIFNRSMRLLARKRGMCLNQRGLFTDVLRHAQVKVNRGRLVEGRDERRIFAALGVPWRPPEQRIC